MMQLAQIVYTECIYLHTGCAVWIDTEQVERGSGLLGWDEGIRSLDAHQSQGSGWYCRLSVLSPWEERWGGGRCTVAGVAVAASWHLVSLVGVD